MESRRTGQMNAAYGGQGVEELRFELPTLISGDGLRATETNYPFGQQGFDYRLSGRGMASNQRVKRSTAVRQYVGPSGVGSGPTIST